MTQYFPESFVSGAFRAATVVLICTNLVSFSAGAYLDPAWIKVVPEKLFRQTQSNEQPESQALPSVPSISNIELLNNRADSLDMDRRFFSELANAEFHAKYLQLNKRFPTLSAEALETLLREDERSTVNQVAKSIGQLNPDLRRNLGSYNQDDFYAIVQQAVNMGLLEEHFKRDISDRLNELLPMMAATPFIDPATGMATPKFQVWCAIAQEEIQKI
ncbi:MAG: hypothetical protein AAF289_01330 [Cyanobacteria bacterium P01_A01_bin.135]